jgi:formimidoylglutamase
VADAPAQGSRSDPFWPRASEWLAGGAGNEAGAPVMAVLGAPLSQASISPSQAHLTPAAIRRALSRYSTLAARPLGVTVDLADVRVVDLGDLDIADLDNIDAQDVVAAAVAELEGSPMLSRHPDVVVLLGGDNSITRPAMRSSVDELGTAGLLTLDAHHDVRDLGGGPSNGTPVRGLIEDGLDGARVVQIGLGMFTNSPEYRRYCDDQRITVVTAAEARTEGVGACVQRHLDLLASTCDEIYVDLDVDVLDAVFAPGCPGARPGGFAPWELTDAAFVAGAHARVIAVDIVEVDAGADVDGVTVDIAAQCLLAVAAGLASRDA